MTAARLIVALDTPHHAEARDLAAILGPEIGLLKLGLEYFVANGPDGVSALDPARIFLDLKLHDIPATVAAATRAVARLAPAMLTIHAGGGAAMVAAARAAIDEIQGRTSPLTKLIAVTVLTSLDAEALHATGVAGGPRQQALRLGRLAIDAGADGLVCSAHEASMLRTALGKAPILVVPGIRPTGVAHDDQARVMTPSAAIAAGADWIVVGRPITRAADRLAACRAILAEIATCPTP